MTIIKNRFEVFILTSKKQGNGIIESKVGLYSIKVSTHICQLNVSYGQDSVSGIVGTITIIKFWTSNFCHIKKITLNHALLELSP
jgi:hypothetical protein